MREITHLMHTYRECSRHLWNSYFSVRDDTSALWEAYEGIRALLLESLVVNELLLEDLGEGDNVGPPILVVVPVATKAVLLIERPSASGRYWDQEKDMVVGPDEIKLAFVDYYDFSEYPVKDFRFYLCKVLSFPRHEEYEGRAALVDVLSARVFHEDH